MNNYKENSKDSRQSKNVIGFNSKLLKSDIRKNALPISAVAGLLEVINLIFGKICIVRMLFGIPCPGCGITRAFQFLLQGKIAEAVYIHPFWVAIVVLFFDFFLTDILSEKRIFQKELYIF